METRMLVKRILMIVGVEIFNIALTLGAVKWNLFNLPNNARMMHQILMIGTSFAVTMVVFVLLTIAISSILVESYRSKKRKFQ